MNRLWAKLKALRGDKRGNVAIMFAFAMVPLIAFVGASVDYSRAAALRTALQAALDSTALMASKLAATQSGTDLTNSAQQFFNAVFVEPNANTDPIIVKYNFNNGAPTVTVSGSSSVNTDFMKIVGFDKLNVGSSSTVTWGNTKLEVALVLDNSGSMSQSGKIGALKTAAQGLLTTLQSASTNPGDVQVSVVPFSKDVNVGSTSASQPWLKWSGQSDTWDENNGTCTKSTLKTMSACTSGGTCSISSFTTQSTCAAGGSCSQSGYNSQNACTSSGGCSLSGYNTQSSCQAAGTCSLSGYSTQSSCTSGGKCSISGYGSKSSCQSAQVCSNPSYTTKNKCTKNDGTWLTGSWTTGSWTAAVWTPPGVWTGATWTAYVWTPKNHSTWNGCITDRDQDYDVNATTPNPSTPASLFVPEQYSYCPPGVVLPLTYNWTALNNAINAMQPNGATNQTLGLAVGWQTLMTDAPFNAPTLKPDTNQVMILLSDGLNTQDRWYGNGSDTSTQVDGRMATACANAKAAKIEIYTIQVNTGGDPQSAVLPACATDSSHFAMVTTSNQIITTFQTIATKLAQLRISK